MAVEGDLRTRLVGSAGLAALVSTRVYPIPLPQAVTFPAMTYQRVSSVTEHASTTDPGDQHVRFQFDCWAATLTGALAVRDQVHARLSRWSSSTGSVTIHDVFRAGERSFYEDEPGAHRVILDYMVHYTE